MNKIELIKELREKTLAPMSDCKSCLEQSEYDMVKAQDLIKSRGLANVSRNSTKVASEGRIVVYGNETSTTALEVNSQTDFTSGSPDFIAFCETAGDLFAEVDLPNFDGDLSKLPVKDGVSLEDLRKELMSKTKENIVVRRWAREEISGDNRAVFSYVHSNSKIGVLLSMEAPSKKDLDNQEFIDLSNNIAMQIAAMAPIAVSPDKITPEDLNKQKAIFETQLKEAGKPETQWSKIIEGRFRKYYNEVCLSLMESVLVPKTTIQKQMDDLAIKLGSTTGGIKTLSFIRLVVGEGIEKPKEEDYAAEISKMTGVVSEEANKDKGGDPQTVLSIISKNIN